jgi:hypothetical protein
MRFAQQLLQSHVKAVVLCGLVICILLSSLSALGAATPATISSDNWAYRQLDDWARRGLLAGYPAAPLAAPATLTRFEAAALVLRATEGIGTDIQRQGMAIAQTVTPPATTDPNTTQVAPPSPADIQRVERGPGVYAEDIAALEKLVAEFRTELVGIGARVADLEKLLADTRSRLAAVEAEQLRHQLFGFIQFRFANDNNAPNNTFAVRRAWVGMSGPLSPKSSYFLQLQLAGDYDGYSVYKGRPDSEVALRDAYIDIVTGKNTRLRAGQAVLPIGYDVPEAETARLEPEHVLVMEALFPDQRDIGLQWHMQKKPNLPAYDIAVINGNGINNTDENDRKDIILATLIPARWGSGTLALYDGRQGNDSYGWRKRLYLSGLQVGKGRTQLRGEYVTGRDQGQDVTGWYARVYRKVTPTGTAYARYDTFDTDSDEVTTSFHRIGIGWAEQIDPRIRLTLHWETSDSDERYFADDYGCNGDAVILQLQAIF